MFVAAMNPHVHLDRLDPAHPLELPFLEDAEEFRLEVEAEGRPPHPERASRRVASSNRPMLFVVRAGEGPLFMAEELALDQVFGNGGAVDRNERFTPSRALAVDGTGDQLLAGPDLPRDEHRDRGLSHVGDEVVGLGHGFVSPDMSSNPSR